MPAPDPARAATARLRPPWGIRAPPAPKKKPQAVTPGAPCRRRTYSVRSTLISERLPRLDFRASRSSSYFAFSSG